MILVKMALAAIMPIGFFIALTDLFGAPVGLYVAAVMTIVCFFQLRG